MEHWDGCRCKEFVEDSEGHRYCRCCGLRDRSNSGTIVGAADAATPDRRLQRTAGRLADNTGGCLMSDQHTCPVPAPVQSGRAQCNVTVYCQEDNWVPRLCKREGTRYNAAGLLVCEMHKNRELRGKSFPGVASAPVSAVEPAKDGEQ